MRLTVEALTVCGSLGELEKFMDSLEESQGSAFTLDYTTADDRAKLHVVASLPTHEEERSNNVLFFNTNVCAMMFHMFREYTDLKLALSKSRKGEDAFLKLLIRFLHISETALGGIFKVQLDADNENEPITEPFGGGILPFLHACNHSCAPNTQFFNVGHTFYTMISRPVKAGGEVFISIG